MNQNYHYNFIRPKVYKQVGIFALSAVFAYAIEKSLGRLSRYNVFSTEETREEINMYREHTNLPGSNQIIEGKDYFVTGYDKIPKFDKRDEVKGREV